MKSSVKVLKNGNVQITMVCETNEELATEWAKANTAVHTNKENIIERT